MAQQKVLVLVGDAAEELDAMYPIYRLREAGYVADVAALTRRDVQLVIHDWSIARGWPFTGTIGVTFVAGFQPRHWKRRWKAPPNGF